MSLCERCELNTRWSTAKKQQQKQQKAAEKQGGRRAKVAKRDGNTRNETAKRGKGEKSGWAHWWNAKYSCTLCTLCYLTGELHRGPQRTQQRQSSVCAPVCVCVWRHTERKNRTDSRSTMAIVLPRMLSPFVAAYNRTRDLPSQGISLRRSVFERLRSSLKTWNWKENLVPLKKLNKKINSIFISQNSKKERFLSLLLNIKKWTYSYKEIQLKNKFSV